MTLRPLFVLCFAFTFLSSSVASGLGLGEVRMVVFTCVFAALLMAALTAHPRIASRDQAGPGLLLILLVFIAFADMLQGGLEPKGYKILLPVAALLFAANLAENLDAARLTRLITGLLTGYVLISALLLVTGQVAGGARGFGGVLRYDVSGSIVQHASLCTLGFLLVGYRSITSPSLAVKTVGIAVALVAIGLALLTGTRTIVMTLTLVAAMGLMQSRKPVRASIALLAALGASAIAFALYTRLVSESFWLRLTGAIDGDYSSGRLHSLGHWLGQATDHPFGLGLGAIRDTFADGRTMLPDGTLLEWPHNEVVRFFAEGGWLGLAFILVLLLVIIGRGLAVARRHEDPHVRLAALALSADIAAGSLLQNYFNAVYGATPLILFIAVAHAELSGRKNAAAAPGDANRQRMVASAH
ncbi:MAG: O-antigen ligase family protein [Geminicoccaceae bacterium]